MNTIDKILTGCSIVLLMFTVTCITIFCIKGETPDVLIENVFSLFNSEIILTFVIWYIKKKKPRS